MKQNPIQTILILALSIISFLVFAGCPKSPPQDVRVPAPTPQHRYIIYFSTENYYAAFETDRYSIDPVTQNVTATVEVVHEAFGSTQEMPVGSTAVFSRPYAIVDRIPDRPNGTPVEAAP